MYLFYYMKEETVMQCTHGVRWTLKSGGAGGAESTKSQIYHYKNQKNPYFPQNLGGRPPPCPPGSGPHECTRHCANYIKFENCTAMCSILFILCTVRILYNTYCVVSNYCQLVIWIHIQCTCRSANY